MSVTLRYRSRLGTARATFRSEDDLRIVHETIAKALPSVDNNSIEISDKPSGPFRSLLGLHGQSIQGLGMKHGDMLFLKFDQATTAAETPSAGIIASTNKLNGSIVPTEPSQTHRLSKPVDQWKTVTQDPVDNVLEARSGKITRPRDLKMCKHGQKGMCDYCMPLDRKCSFVPGLVLISAFDASYLEAQKIKHSSFHAYLRKINSATNKPELNSSFIPPLTEPDVTVDRECTTGHAPWPGGICSKCQPSAITLQRQEFRMIDHLEFGSSNMIDSFLNFWRKSGYQRFGYMLGFYATYDAVPLGQKAVVEAIYEPPQTSQADGLELGPWEEESKVLELATRCGLQVVGVIFTDLTDDGNGTGSVLAKRHIDSYFLSSLEAQLAATYQASHPNKTHWSASGQFGSKFVTAVISGSPEGRIEIQPYQISEQGVAMFNAQIIEPSTDPNTILICPESTAAYIPELFFSTINEYGRQVKENAKPAFPMEFLLVTLTYGFPNESNPRFANTSFPIENRAAIGEAADLSAIAKQLNLGSETSVSALSDFHLLLYLASLDILGVADLELLVNVATTQDVNSASQLVKSDGWATLLLILNESGGTSSELIHGKRMYTDDGSVILDG